MDKGREISAVKKIDDKVQQKWNEKDFEVSPTI